MFPYGNIVQTDIYGTRTPNLDKQVQYCKKIEEFIWLNIMLDIFFISKVISGDN